MGEPTVDLTHSVISLDRPVGPRLLLPLLTHRKAEHHQYQGGVSNLPPSF
jgi:hypothetical protein